MGEPEGWGAFSAIDEVQFPCVDVTSEIGNYVLGGADVGEDGVVLAEAAMPSPADEDEDEDAEPEGLPFVDGARGHGMSGHVMG